MADQRGVDYKLGFCTEDEFLDRRRQENIDTILLKLKHSSL